jgi:L-malate glycosyltransferase
METGLNFSVLHVATALSWRGGEQQVAYLVEELQKNKIKQFVLCSKGSAMEAWCIKNNILVFTANKRSAFDFSFGLRIKKLCSEYKIDIVHTHDSHAHTFAVYAAVAGNKAAIIVSRRVDFEISSSFLSRFKYNYPLVKRIICVSDIIKQIVSMSVNDKSKVITVHSGIDLSRFERISREGRLHKEYNLSADVRLIGNVSALAPHKDFSTFLRTVNILKERLQNVMFFIIGSGPEKENIENEIRQQNLGKFVIMTGFRDDIPEILPELDLFLMSSETEGLGTTLLDAFACKVPVVATAAGGIPEIVIHDKTGMLSPVGNAEALAENAVRVMNDKMLREKIIGGALKLLSSFTREATAVKTIAEYKSVLS